MASKRIKGKAVFEIFGDYIIEQYSDGIRYISTSDKTAKSNALIKDKNSISSNDDYIFYIDKSGANIVLNSLLNFLQFDLELNDITTTAVTKEKLFIGFGFKNGKILIYSLVGKKPLIQLTIFKNESINYIGFLGSTTVAIATRDNIKILDLMNKKILTTIPLESELIDFIGKKDEDTLMIATSKSVVKIFSLTEKKIIKEYLLPEKDTVIKKVHYAKKYDSYFIQTSDKLFKLYAPNKVDRFIDIPISDIENFTIIEKYDEIFCKLKDEAGYEKKIIQYDTDEDGENRDSDSSKPSQYKYLIVDDSTTMRLVIKKAIMNHYSNIELFEAKEGGEALRVLKENPDIDTVILDWNMEPMNGEEVVDALNQDPTLNPTIIMATTEGSKEKVRRMLKKGVKGYLVKPFNTTAIVGLVKKTLEMAQDK